MKMTATQGVLFATLILAVIGGALQEVATALQTVDLSWMGAYRTPFLSFFQNAWIIIVATFLYNVFMYFRQNQLAALKQTAELYDWRKLVTTLTWFVGILGPMAALVSDAETKGVIALVVIIVTAVTQEISKIFGVDTTTASPTSTSNTPATPTSATATTNTTTVTASTNLNVGTYQDWAVKIVNGYLQFYPPAGGMMSLGSVIGYSLSTDFLSMVKPAVDQAIAQANAPKTAPIITPPT